MKKRVNRRIFLARATLATLSATTLGACTTRENPPPETAESVSPEENGFQEELSKNRQMPRELVKKLLDQKVDQYMQLSHHCAQSSFLALKEQFGLRGEQVVKALTPLPGMAERGETCGAVTGPLMALGLIYGRDIHHLNNWDTYQAALVPAGAFCEKFEKEFGTTLCHEVQEEMFGRCYRLRDPAELQEFQNAGATDKCSEVVRKAVHMAAEIILEDSSI
ncbi:MAG: C-GCAxxG-C-C family protein [Bacteroidales bacterium]|nr:C-GCAxxG-C-C family protein [Bacteroidales bacterium]